MNNNQALDMIMEDLKNGEHYGKLELWDNHNKEYLKYPTFHAVLYKCGRWVYWNHAGSSAEEYDRDRIEWVILNIFQMEPLDFLRKYYTETRARAALIA